MLAHSVLIGPQEVIFGMFQWLARIEYGEKVHSLEQTPMKMLLTKEATQQQLWKIWMTSWLFCL